MNTISVFVLIVASAYLVPIRADESSVPQITTPTKSTFSEASANQPVRGTIDLVDSASHQVVLVAGPTTSPRPRKIASDAVITREAGKISFADLRPGDKVILGPESNGEIKEVTVISGYDNR